MMIPQELVHATPPWMVTVRMLPLGMAGLGDDSRILGNLAQDILAYVNSPNPLPPDVVNANISGDIKSMCGQLQYWNQVNGEGASCPANLDDLLAQAHQSYSAWYSQGVPYQPPAAVAPIVNQIGTASPPGYQRDQSGNLQPIPGWPNSVAGGTSLYSVQYNNPAAAAPAPAPPAPVATQLTPAQIMPASAPTPTPATPAATSSTSTSTSTSKATVTSSTEVMDWLKGSMFGGVPNWALVAVAAGGVFFYMGRSRR